MLTIESLNVQRGGFPVLSDLSLSIPDGEVLGVLGRNGAGKTTLVEAIAGGLPVNGGSILFDGKEIAGLPSYKIARLGLGVVPEGRRLFWNMTVRENLALGAHGAHWRWGGPAESAYDLVYELFPDLKEMPSRRAAVLSGGQQQMLAVGRALMASPKLLVLDEPSFGLSPQLVSAMCAHLKKLEETGLSILIAEQNLDVALEVVSRVAVLDDGGIVAAGRFEDLETSSTVRRALFGAHGEQGDEQRETGRGGAEPTTIPSVEHP